jgi:hypothetical protein
MNADSTSGERPGALQESVHWTDAFFRSPHSLIFNVIAQFILWRLRAAYEPLAKTQAVADIPAPLWRFWVPFAFGLILAVLWIRALIGLLSVWHDSSSRVLRFSASVLLIPFGIATCQLLLMPFHVL